MAPFKSKAQMKACFAKKARGQAKGWDCEKWAKETNMKNLPSGKKSSGKKRGK